MLKKHPLSFPYVERAMSFCDFLTRNLVHCPISTFITYAREPVSSLKCLLLHEPIGMTPFVLVIIADVSKRLRCRRFDVTFYYKRQSGVINHRFAPHDEVSTRTVNLSYQRGTKLSQKKREGYTSG